MSVKAEYMASSNAMKEAIWLRTLLRELNFLQVSVTIIYTDNQGCIALTHNPVNHSHAKHINIKHHFIHECVKQDEVKLKYILTKDMLVRRGSHWDGSLQNGLGDEWTCGMTLASAYVLHCLSATWLQLQMKERKSK